jgi:predicted GIY-YIG superfamily endonuclease
MHRRIADHNSGKNVSTRRNSGEWVIVYMEVFRNSEDARKREARLKHHGRAKQELLKRIQHSLLGD